MKKRGISQIAVNEVPASMIAVAMNRTRPFVDSLSVLDYNLHVLAASCYLQGINDTVTVTVKTPLPYPPDPDLGLL